MPWSKRHVHICLGKAVYRRETIWVILSKSFDHRPCGNNTAGNTCCRKAGPAFPPSHGVATATAAAAAAAASVRLPGD